MKQIKDKNDLPEGFSLQNYDTVPTFSIVDWVVNLEFRVLSAHMLAENFRPEEQIIRCENVLDEPIMIPTADFENYPGFSKHIYKASVKDFEAADFFWHGRDCQTDERQIAFLRGFDEFVDSSTAYLEKASASPDVVERMGMPYYKLLEAGGIRHSGDVIAKIDLHNSDQKLIADFTSWLKTTRLQTNVEAPRKKFTPDDFAAWASGGILPYLDLTLWATANGVEITQQLLGTTIFPDEYNVNLAERIRKSTRPLAKLMTREVFTDALRSQALAELAEQKSSPTIPDKLGSL